MPAVVRLTFVWETAGQHRKNPYFIMERISIFCGEKGIESFAYDLPWGVIGGGKAGGIMAGRPDIGTRSKDTFRLRPFQSPLSGSLFFNTSGSAAGND